MPPVQYGVRMVVVYLTWFKFIPNWNHFNESRTIGVMVSEDKASILREAGIGAPIVLNRIIGGKLINFQW